MALARIPIGWNHPIDQEYAPIQKLGACPCRKSGPTFPGHALEANARIRKRYGRARSGLAAAIPVSVSKSSKISRRHGMSSRPNRFRGAISISCGFFALQLQTGCRWSKLASGGWRWTHHSPTGSGPEGSSPNGTGRVSVQPPTSLSEFFSAVQARAQWGRRRRAWPQSWWPLTSPLPASGERGGRRPGETIHRAARCV